MEIEKLSKNKNTQMLKDVNVAIRCFANFNGFIFLFLHVLNIDIIKNIGQKDKIVPAKARRITIK